MSVSGDRKNYIRDTRVIRLRESGLTMSQIARECGVTKNTVIGIVHRHARHLVDESRPSSPPPRTLWDRMQALHDEMDAVLAAYPVRRLAGSAMRDSAARCIAVPAALPALLGPGRRV